MPECFDARTAYECDWQFLDAIVDAQLIPRTAEGHENADLAQDVKAREGDIASLGFSPVHNFEGRTAVWDVWAVDSEIGEPHEHDALVVDGAKWTIQRVTKKEHGPHYLCVCTSTGITGVSDEF